MTERQQTYTVAELAERWRIEYGTVLAHIRAGRLRAINVGRSSRRPTYRVPHDAVLAFEASQSAKPLPPAGRRKRREMPVIEFF